MTSTATLDTAAVLAGARRARAEADRAEVVVLERALDWAHAHPATDGDDVATWADTPVPLAGAGAPLVSAFAVAEFGAALGMSPTAGRQLFSETLEMAHRLPRIWERVQAGTLKAWRGRRVAAETTSLSVEAAAWVDEQVVRYSPRIGPAALSRLVDHAITLYMPEFAADRRRAAADGRYVAVDHQQVSFNGTSIIHGELDLVDALDLDARLSVEAQALKELGCEDSLDARRSIALGNLARGEQPLPLEAAASPTPTPLRDIVLYVHQKPGDDAALLEKPGPVLLTTEQVRLWCGNPDARVIVRPVIDLAEEITCPGYEPSDRLREQVILRDGTCVFPHCTRPARSCDADHIEPYDPSGPQNQTTTSNLGSLCRFHHRLKTHGGWTYTMIEPGTYLWRSPHGYTYLRTPDGGTEDLTPRPVDPPGS